MNSKHDLRGRRFGRWLVLSKAENRGSFAFWLCQCECGNQSEVAGYALRRGTTTSCGCFRREFTVATHLTHGMKNSPEWRAWSNMRSRCSSPSHAAYSRYGGRGIRVCERWNKFENFLADMGLRPAGKTLERKDNNGDYSPENCVWATWKEQNNNKRSNRKLSALGLTKNMSQWADYLGIRTSRLWELLDRGFSLESLVGVS